MNIHIELFSLEREQISELHLILSKIYPGDTEQMEYLKNDIHDMDSTARSKPTFLVAKNEQKIIGFVSYHPVLIGYKRYGIAWLMIDPVHQRKGVGTRLVMKVIEKIKQLEGMVIYIETELPEMAKKFGFKPVFVAPDTTTMVLSV